MNRAAAALVSAAVLLSACSPTASEPSAGTDPEWLTQAIALPREFPEPSWCVHQIAVHPKAAFSDLAGMLAGTHIRACSWLRPSQLVAYEPTTGSACRAPVAPNIKVTSTLIKAQMPPPDLQCAGLLGQNPTAIEVAGLHAFCFAVEPATAQTDNSFDHDGMAFGLMEIGLPVRFYETSGSVVRVWVDLQNYPWPGKFSKSLQYVAEQRGVAATAVACD